MLRNDPKALSAASPAEAPVQEKDDPATEEPYLLDDQVGFLLRQVSQRHTALFASSIGNDLTPTQWAAISKLQDGPVSQNLLGRQTAMHAATIKGVIDRLTQRGLTQTTPDPEDGRRLLVGLTEEGKRVFDRSRRRAAMITEETMAPLSSKERATFLALLRKML